MGAPHQQLSSQLSVLPELGRLPSVQVSSSQQIAHDRPRSQSLAPPGGLSQTLPGGHQALRLSQMVTVGVPPPLVKLTWEPYFPSSTQFTRLLLSFPSSALQQSLQLLSLSVSLQSKVTLKKSRLRVRICPACHNHNHLPCLSQSSSLCSHS